MSTPKPNTHTALLASPEQVFSLGVSFITRINSLNLSGEVVQAAKDQTDHPLWKAINDVFFSPPDALARQVAREETARPRIEVLSECPKPCVDRSADDQVADQRRLYESLGWTFTESGLVVPKRQKGFDRLLVMANTALTNNGMYGVIDASFSCWRYDDDLDKAVPKKDDERHPSNGSYFIWVRDCVEADEALKGKSARMIMEDRIKTLTALERMYLEALFYQETGQHLDQNTITLCSGSRRSDGNVPYAFWLSVKFRICWTLVDLGSVGLRARQAVTL